MMKKTLKELGEFNFIESIRKNTRTDKTVRLGIGDDTAILSSKNGQDILFTTDMLIENKHFRLNEAAPSEIGWKAMAVNISDIAAMGGLPTHVVIAVGISGDTQTSFVNELYSGLSKAAKKFKVNIVGGDTNNSDKLVISIAMLGRIDRGTAVKRSGAKIGDAIFVTGSLGGSYISHKHLNFTPRIKEAQFLVKNFNIHSMMDLSDGLSSDIRRLAKESKVGALFFEKNIPVSKHAGNLEHAFTDGEDFELLFTLSPSEAKRLKSASERKGLAKFHEIGRIVPKAEGIKIFDSHGKSRVLPEKGFDHYKNR